MTDELKAAATNTNGRLQVNCQDRTDSIYLYAAGALPEAEAEELRGHLATGCPACVGELAGANAVLAMLPLSLRPVLPPDDLKERVMRRIDRKVRFERRETVEPVVRIEPVGMRILRLLAPAAVAAGITLIVTHYYMNEQVHEAQKQALTCQQNAADALAKAAEMAGQRDDARSNAATQTHLVEALTKESAGQKRAIAEVSKELDGVKQLFPDELPVLKLFDADSVRVVDLKPTPLQQGAAGKLVWDQKGRKWAVMLSGMKKPEAGETYEIWAITAANAKVRVGVFDVAENGSASVLVDLPKDGGTFSYLAVTNEKTGGADQPTGQLQVLTPL